MARTARLAALGALLLGASCKGTEDWLNDLRTVHDYEGNLTLAVYDAGQLSYEALAGLADVEALTLSQAARAVALAARVVDCEEQPLLRAQAVLLMARIAVRYPFPPASEPFAVEDPAKAVVEAGEMVNALDKHEKLLEIETTHLPGLLSPDRAVADLHLARLREATGVDVGPTYDAWLAWWTENGPRVRAEAAEASREPLRRLAQLRFGGADKGTSLGGARATLLFLGYRTALFDLPETRAETEAAIVRIARQTVVQAISKSLRSDDSRLRAAAALAAERVADTTFAAPLQYALPRERDPATRAALARALALYPSRETVEALVAQMPEGAAGGAAATDEERSLGLAVQSSLIAVTGEDFGVDGDAWDLWWERTGSKRWP